VLRGMQCRCLALLRSRRSAPWHAV